MKRFIAFLTIAFFIFATPMAFAGNKADAEAVAGAQAGIEFNDNSENKVTDRDFVGSSPSVTAGTNALFLPNSGDDVSFRRVQELIKFGGVFSETSLKIMTGGSIAGHFDAINDFDKPMNKYEDGERYILISLGIKVVDPNKPDNFIVLPPAQFRMSAPFDYEAKNIKTTSFQLIAEAALDAINNGDNVLWVEFEGWKDKANASGWGIGTHTAAGAISDSGKASGVGGGGLGYSSNEVGMEKKPWIRGYAGCLPVMLDISGDNVIRTAKKKNSNFQTASTYNGPGER